MSDFKPPILAHHFNIDCGGMLTGSFQKISGLTVEFEVVEYKASGPKGEELIISQPGRQKPSKITLERGMTDTNMEMATWVKQVQDGDFIGARKNGSITAFNQKHQEVARWNFENAWPSKCEWPGFDSGQNQAQIEKLEVICERLIRVS